MTLDHAHAITRRMIQAVIRTELAQAVTPLSSFWLLYLRVKKTLDSIVPSFRVFRAFRGSNFRQAI
jgi:hypothetical protein